MPVARSTRPAPRAVRLRWFAELLLELKNNDFGREKIEMSSVTLEIPTSEPSSASLVRAAQQGDRDAVGELFTRYRQHVVAVAMRRLRDENEAQELCQEVFVQVILKIKQLREPECFAGWLRSITNRMAINRQLRRPPSVSVEPQSLESSCVEENTPYCSAITGERASEVHRGLSRLRELDRDTLEAFYLRGNSLVEMSDRFEAPIGTIKRRLHVARQRLAKEVEELVSV